MNVYRLHFRYIKYISSFKMSNNHPLFPPTGNNNSINNNKKKRKNRTYLPAGDDASRQNKRINAPQRANTPMMASPAQPSDGFGNPQLANPAIYGPHNPTPFTPMGSASLVPQYPLFQAQIQPQAQYLQQPPQHVPQPGAYRLTSNMQPTSGFASLGFATPQSPRNPQQADGSAQRGKKKVELVPAENVEAHDSRVIPTKLTVKGRSGKHDFVAQSNNPNVKVSTTSDPKGSNVINDQNARNQGIHGGLSEVITTMNNVPLLATGSRAHNRNIEFSDSTENLISTKRGGRRQKPGRPQNQAQLPAPAQAQAHPQGQPTLQCANCNRQGHLVGDCVGPPNQMHGDLPACPVCNSFGGGRRRSIPGNQGHRFDDCHVVQAVFNRLQRGMDLRLTYEDLANITDDELLMFFNGLVKRRARKTPIRTKLVCWVDVLRETVRRHPTSAAIHELGGRHPWTKSFAIEQLNPANVLAKPWDFYDYAAGNIGSLPAGPIEQITITFPDFVANGFHGVPPQVFSSDDRQQRSERRETDDSSEANNTQPPALTPTREGPPGNAGRLVHGHGQPGRCSPVEQGSRSDR